MSHGLDLKDLSIKALLDLQADTLSELRQRGVIRTSNKPTGDLAEFLFCKAFNWYMSNNSQNGFDAKCIDGIRYQIKARQIINKSRSERQLSAIRRIEDANFDYIAAVLFNSDYSIHRAAIIPYQVIVDRNPYYSAHDNKHIFYLTDDVWDIDGVQDVTSRLIEALNIL